MMHFFRRPKIHLDCFTSRRDVIEYAPVVNAIETIPTWWKELPKEKTNGINFYPTATMKTCIGMYDYYAKSIAMPLWSDLCIEIHADKGYSWKFSDSVTDSAPHDANEYTGLLHSISYGHLKIMSPWAFCAKEDVDWMVSEPIYNRKTITDYVLAQGLLNFYRQSGSSLQILLSTETPKKFILPFGTPFLFTPLSDKKVVIHRQLVSKNEFFSIKEKSRAITFINKYKNQQKITKCPYKDKTK
jgi:hypothetical protein